MWPNRISPTCGVPDQPEIRQERRAEQTGGAEQVPAVAEGIGQQADDLDALR